MMKAVGSLDFFSLADLIWKMCGDCFACMILYDDITDYIAVPHVLSPKSKNS